MSAIDLNRSGVALMEIVSKPDLRSSEEAKAFLAKLRSILRYLGTCDGDMEKGSLRADVNVSVRKPGRAARHPLRDQERQFDPLRRPGDRARGAPPDRDHRGRRHDRSGDPAVRSGQGRDPLDALEGGGARLPLFPRSRSAAARIRRRPMSTTLKAHLPELPDEKKARFISEHGLSAYDADVLVAEKALADYFEAVAKGRDAKAAANWVINELSGRLNKEGKDIADSPGQRGAARRRPRPDQGGHDLGQDRQGPVRDRLERGRRPARDRRTARHEAGHRHRRDREGGRRDRRQQSRQGRARPRPSRRRSAGSSAR